VALHGPVSLKDVLVGPASAVVDAEAVVGRHRAVEQQPRRAVLRLGDEPVEDVVRSQKRVISASIAAWLSLTFVGIMTITCFLKPMKIMSP
jgi:hypothetical protein